MEMFSILNLPLSLAGMRRMDGERVYVASERAWARLDASGPYPLLILDSGERVNWEDWPDVQAGGIYQRPPVLRSFLRDLGRRSGSS